MVTCTQPCHLRQVRDRARLPSDAGVRTIAVTGNENAAGVNAKIR
jgi:hypothetical protein